MSRQIAPAGTLLLGLDAEASAHQLHVETREINDAEIDGYREQDRFLPINNIQRLMKSTLPDTIKVSKDAKECVQECTSEFISFITSEAAERANNEKRKTVTGDDILASLRTLGFDQYADVLLIYLAKYRNLQREGPVRKKARRVKQDSLATSVEPAHAPKPDSDTDSESSSGNDSDSDE